MNHLRIATRKSALAIIQAKQVAALLVAAHPGLSVSLVEVSTSGDLDQTGSVAQLTEVGAFVRSLQRAVIDGDADLAVHSLKDLPVNSPDQLVVAAVPPRAAPFDVMVGMTVDQVPFGGLVGTGSPRRTAQLLELRPDLRTVELRGNIDTRLRKLAAGEVSAAILAQAGLERLGRVDAIAQRFQVAQMVPAPGQGALAVEAVKGSKVATMVAVIDDRDSRTLIESERLLLAETGAGCRSALGALATWADGAIKLQSYVFDEAGGRRSIAIGATPAAVVAGARQELSL